MRTALLLVALGALYFVGGSHIPSHTADMDFLHKQKRIFELLLFVQQDQLTDAEFYDVGRNYDIEGNVEAYKDKHIVQDFLSWYKLGMLSRDAIFSPYYPEHREEMQILYRLFYTARDFQTFYKTAAWARLHLNNGVFTSAFTVAVFYREDCKYMRLPAIYEIYPNLFYDSNVIQEAHRIKMTRGLVGTPSMENVDSYMIYANYTGKYVRAYNDEEYKLDYFIEDVGLNTFYYYFRQVLPYWLSSTEYNIPKEIRGYFYYYLHQQLIARYNLERISNDLDFVEDYDWYKSSFPGYYSSLMYSNGIVMPQRQRYSQVPYYKFFYLQEIDVLEKRIMNAIDSGYVYDYNGKQINIYTPEGFNILGNMIEGNADTCNSRYYGMYETLARDILGFNIEYQNKNKYIPSALQNYATSMRDPAFYWLYNRITNYFLRYKKYMPVYTQNELAFPGVKIESVNVDKLLTYYDYCDTLINNAISVENFKEGMSLRMKARRYCLNYKPYTYRLNVNSDKDVKGVLRIFIGPSYEGYAQDIKYLNKYYKYFVEMDKFIVTLRAGSNNIERRSSDSSLTMPDMDSSDVYYKKLQKAIGGSEPFSYYEKLFGFPERLTLPKGKPEGVPYRMFFYLSPLDEAKVTQYELPIFGRLTYDGKPFGYPLDRPMYPWKFQTPNMFFKDVYVYHAKDKATGGY